MRYEREARRFVLAVSRFRWETARAAQGGAPFERIACGIAFEGVAQVRVQGIDQGRRERMLELLAILGGAAAAERLGERPAAGREIVLLAFAGGGTIRLEVEAIRCRLDDFGEPWPTQWRPRHRLDSDDA